MIPHIPQIPDVLLITLHGIVALTAVGFLGSTVLNKPTRELTRRLGLDGLPNWLIAIATVIYSFVLCILLSGLIVVIWEVITFELDGTEGRERDFLFFVLRLAGLTTVVGAVVALPVTLNRLKIARQNRDLERDSQFNAKINAATELLYARRLVTDVDNQGKTTDRHEDDITRRNAAIDRLERLAREKPDYASDIARMLSIYVRELSRENQAEKPPATTDTQEMRDWAQNLKVKRTDMENAVQTLGRMIPFHGLRKDNVNLRNANLQAFDLARLCFDGAVLSDAHLQGADLGLAKLIGAKLGRAKLQGADLDWARLQGAWLNSVRLQGADLGWAELQGADLKRAQLQGADFEYAALQGTDLSGAEMDIDTNLTAVNFEGALLTSGNVSKVPQIAEHLDQVFGDASVRLPDGVKPPDHWSGEELDSVRSKLEWRNWQRSIGFDPDDYPSPLDRLVD